MPVRFGTASRRNLAEIHPDLRRVVELAATYCDVDFTVFEGSRTLEEQRVLFRKGKSKTMQSRHLVAANGWSHATDLVPTTKGKPDWSKWEPFHTIAQCMFKAANELKIPLRWGGNWQQKYTRKLASFADGPHFELPVAHYSGKKGT
jgi:peptidoglycan L-alanyl-D-glutamate endopeptidase CwlK